MRLVLSISRGVTLLPSITLSPSRFLARDPYPSALLGALFCLSWVLTHIYHHELIQSSSTALLTEGPRCFRSFSYFGKSTQHQGGCANMESDHEKAPSQGLPRVSHKGVGKRVLLCSCPSAFRAPSFPIPRFTHTHGPPLQRKWC